MRDMSRRVDRLVDCNGTAGAIEAARGTMIMFAEADAKGAFKVEDAVGDAMTGPIVVKPSDNFLHGPLVRVNSIGRRRRTSQILSQTSIRVRRTDISRSDSR